MAIKSIFNPKESIGVGVLTGILVYAIYDRALPNNSVMHATPANDLNLEAGRKKATLTAAGVLAGVTLLTRDANVFIIGGLVLVALDFNARHANAASPETGKLVSPSGYGLSGQGSGENFTPGSSTALTLVPASA